MIKPATITQWMQQPASFSAEDRKQAAAILKSYPYFVPVRYLEGAEYHKKQAFSPSMLNMMRLYCGNWLYFYQFMKEAEKASQSADAAVSSATNPITSNWEDDFMLEDEALQDSTLTNFEEDFEESPEEESEIWGEMTIEQADELPQVDTDNLADVVEGFSSLYEEESQQIDNETLQVDDLDIEATNFDMESMQNVDDVVVEVDELIIDVSAPEKPEEKTNMEASEPVVKSEPEPTPVSTEEEKSDLSPRSEKTPLIQPIYTEDYFLYQGIQAPPSPQPEPELKKEKSLMVVMSFSEWLMHFKTKGEREKAEAEDQKALKTMWQKEKLAAALEEENEEIPENVFEMAVNSITKEDDLVSESLAEILVKQGKFEKAIDMYKKLSLRNPQKNAYFARKIEQINKEKLI
jgi:tetratricopeptide (TPR) repeat protein